MTLTKIWYLAHLINEEYVEYDYEIEYEYEPYMEGRISGPPEQCYPSEGGYATFSNRGSLRRRSTALTNKPLEPWEIVPFSVFLEGVIADKAFVDDPPDKKYRKTAREKAIKYIESELAETGEEEMRDARDAAEEARYDYNKDEGLDRY